MCKTTKNLIDWDSVYSNLQARDQRCVSNVFRMQNGCKPGLLQIQSDQTVKQPSQSDSLRGEFYYSETVWIPPPPPSPQIGDVVKTAIALIENIFIENKCIV